MIKPTRSIKEITADINNLEFEIDDYKHGEPAAWKCGYSVSEAESKLEKLKREREVVEEKMNFMYDTMQEIS